MPDLKKYIVWVDYGSEGWSPVDSADTFEGASDLYLQYMGNGHGKDSIVITEYIPVKLIPAKVEQVQEVAWR